MNVHFKEKYSLSERWTHWINFPLLSLMIWSGIWIYWANDVYSPFFPNWFYERFNVPFNLALGMAVHFATAWLFVINGVIFVLFLIFSGEWREFLPNRHSWKNAFLVLLYDLKLRKEEPPHGKFNAAQQIAYTGVTTMGIGSVFTGFAIYKPTQLHWLTFFFGGYENARLIHFILTLLYVAFFLMHVIQVARAGWQAFSAMITGYEVHKDGE